ncbi:MAG: DNA polymerase III subunit epsilon [Rhodospirillum sp.]|nr:DNA polymerase III subunit epsilon [Rhodospirillum sp.]MCF8489532.1 DNA polymerase III subunit epsilon [Rhodospirillum sp.]MCF8502049.1 DNA polymerase III subunit epsilon [Rhodospirillum sp.]
MSTEKPAEEPVADSLREDDWEAIEETRLRTGVVDKAFDKYVHTMEPLWRHVFGIDLRRWWLGMRSPHGPLKDYYRKDYATLDLPWNRVEFLAIDLEATGLDPDHDEILSIGYVPVIKGRVKLAEAGYHLVRPRRPVPEETAVIHGILDGHLENAPSLREVLPHVLKAMTGRVPIAHHARLERFFLSRACRQLYGNPLDVPFVDTMVLERKAFSRSNREIKQGDLRLGRIRERYGLPRYRAHDALVDAIGTAELMLAQASAMEGGKKAVRMGDLLS